MMTVSASVDRRDLDAAAIAFAATQHNTLDVALQYFTAPQQKWNFDCEVKAFMASSR